MSWLLKPDEKRQKTSFQNGASLSSSTKRKCGTAFLELSPARLWPHLPKRAQIRASPPTPPRFASLRFAYTYTQPRPSASFRNILYYIILYYIILYYIILYYIILYCFILNIILYYIILYYTILYYIILYYIICDVCAPYIYGV